MSKQIDQQTALSVPRAGRAPAMHLSGRILSGRAVVLQPCKFDHFHAAIRASGRCVVAEQCAQGLFKRLGIFLTEACFFGKLNVHRAISHINSAINAVLHSDSVGSFFVGIGAGFKINQFCDLCACYINSVNAERRMNAYRAANSDRNCVAAFAISFLPDLNANTCPNARTSSHSSHAILA